MSNRADFLLPVLRQTVSSAGLYPDRGHGTGYRRWAASDRVAPYRSFCSGLDMRGRRVEEQVLAALDERLKSLVLEFKAKYLV